MPVVPKSKTIQFRVDPELFDKFSAEADANGTSASAVLRGFMRSWVEQMARRREKAVKDAEWAATLESRRQAVVAVQGEKKSPVGPVNKPMSLSEKRKAEKAAKDARRARKEDRY